MAANCAAGQHAILINGAPVLTGDENSVKVAFGCLTGKRFEDGPSYRLYLKTFGELQRRGNDQTLSLNGGEQITMQDAAGRIIGEGCILGVAG